MKIVYEVPSGACGYRGTFMLKHETFFVVKMPCLLFTKHLLSHNRFGQLISSETHLNDHLMHSRSRACLK